MNFKPQKINVDDLKVGDIVARKIELNYGWCTWICDAFEELQVMRISPKKTKILFEKTGLEINPKITALFAVTEEMREYNKIAKEQQELANLMYRYSRNIRNSEKAIMGIRDYVKGLSDEERTKYLSDFRKPYLIMEQYKKALKESEQK